MKEGIGNLSVDIVGDIVPLAVGGDILLGHRAETLDLLCIDRYQCIPLPGIDHLKGQITHGVGRWVVVTEDIGKGLRIGKVPQIDTPDQDLFLAFLIPLHHPLKQ